MNTLLTLMLLSGAQVFQIVGAIGPSPIEQGFNQVHLEAVSMQFAAHAEIGSDGRFSFKKVPEGLYKLRFIAPERGKEVERSVEIRSKFADERGRVAVKIDMRDNVVESAIPVNIASINISPKAADELRKAYESGGDVRKIREHLEKAIEISPDYAEALNNLGALNFRQARYSEAAALFQHALKVNPDLYSARVNLAGAWIALGDYEKSLEENLRCLKVRPQDSLAQAQTGQALFFLKRYDEALPHLQAARELDPMSFTFPDLFIAQIRDIQGNAAAAIQEYRRLLNNHPGLDMAAAIETRIRLLEQRSR